ncbi:hypothetical protein IC232_03475 [Microvirga sp. BT688]|uniref:hypothetical protein n=1 Tax=Microvirga sp. TaxID=1873136 RepID=UPI0016870FBF|nr:hypothetical protein [Microvirga sp.]MBD2745750.1 hypothetical protein [Microvirga sp.]
MLMTPETMQALEVRRSRLVQMFEGCLSRPDMYRIYATPLSRHQKSSEIPKHFSLGALPEAAIEGGMNSDFMALVHVASSEAEEPSDIRCRRLWKDVRDRAHEAVLALRQRMHVERMVRLGSSRIRVPSQAQQASGGPQ